MKNNTFTAILAVMLAVALMFSFTACGSKEAPETAAPTEATAAKPLPTVSGQTGELSSFTMTATAWSSSNGATITFTATPENHEDGQSAIFLARLDGEEADRITCDFDGTVYTAELDLNAADGYFYYCVLVAPDGTEKEVDINTPDNMASPELINLATALETFCTMTLNESKAEGDSLSITDGYFQVQLPLVTRTGEPVTIASVNLYLKSGETEIASQALDIPAEVSDLFCQGKLTGISFEIPEMEDDQQLVLMLDVVLSDGQVLTTTGGNWHYAGGELLGVVG